MQVTIAAGVISNLIVVTKVDKLLVPNLASTCC
jgi:hypothetical protein